MISISTTTDKIFSVTLNNFTTVASDTICTWDETRSSSFITVSGTLRHNLPTKSFALYSSFTLGNGDFCKLYNWVLVQSKLAGKICVAKVAEILQVLDRDKESAQNPNFLLVELYTTKGEPSSYGMPTLESMNLYEFLEYIGSRF